MDVKQKKSVIRRLSIVEGHLRKVKKMVCGDAYCLDVIHQSQAVQAALRKVDQMVLHGHLHSCILKDIHETKGKKEALVQELLDIYEKKCG
jgi:CsoR family transcriptional regulator, copper-sensing transcriptional repressor